jgi:hypothetical protein
VQGLEDLVELTLKTGPRILDCSSRNIGARLEVISRIVSNTFVALSGSFPRFLFDLERIIATAAADIAKKVTLRNMDKLLTGGKARVIITAACHGGPPSCHPAARPASGHGPKAGASGSGCPPADRRSLACGAARGLRLTAGAAARAGPG